MVVDAVESKVVLSGNEFESRAGESIGYSI